MNRKDFELSGIVDIVVKDAADGGCEFLMCRVLYDQGVAGGERQLLCDSGADEYLSGQWETADLACRLQCPERQEGLRLVCTVEFDGCHGAFMCLDADTGQAARADRRACGGPGEPGCHTLRLRRLDTCLDLVPLDRLVLEIGDPDQGILDAESGQYKRCAAADADKHHEQALFVAEHVPERDFVEK